MAYITNFSHFNQEESGIQFLQKGISAAFLPGIQKSSINTVGDFCMNPFGGVSNLDCPEWDPSCNCIVTQYMPTKAEPQDKTLIKLKKNLNECSLIKKHLNDNKFNEGWLGIDYTNPYSTYNCPNCQPIDITKNSEKLIESYRLKNEDDVSKGYSGPFLYSLGISGISGGITLNSEAEKDEFPERFDKDIEVDWECTDGCFKYYLEYSKTNATFWNTPPKTPLLRKGQIGAYNAQKIKILVNGDSRVRVGNLINLDTSLYTDPFKTRFSGRWMIYRIERIITHKKHSMFLFLACHF